MNIKFFYRSLKHRSLWWVLEIYYWWATRSKPCGIRHKMMLSYLHVFIILQECPLTFKSCAKKTRKLNLFYRGNVNRISTMNSTHIRYDVLPCGDKICLNTQIFFFHISFKFSHVWRSIIVPYVLKILCHYVCSTEFHVGVTNSMYKKGFQVKIVY